MYLLKKKKRKVPWQEVIRQRCLLKEDVPGADARAGSRCSS